MAESMPATLTHSDLHPGNLYGSGQHTILIDWAFIGVGPVGEDAGNLLFDAIWDFFVPPDQIGSLRAALVDGYCAGLEDANWRGDPEAVVRAMAAVGQSSTSGFQRPWPRRWQPVRPRSTEGPWMKHLAGGCRRYRRSSVPAASHCALAPRRLPAQLPRLGLGCLAGDAKASTATSSTWHRQPGSVR